MKKILHEEEDSKSLVKERAILKTTNPSVASYFSVTGIVYRSSGASGEAEGAVIEDRKL